MSLPVLFDTSVYITELRRGNASVLSTRNLAWLSPLWLSAVVLEELYAGISSRRDRRAIEKLEYDFNRVKRLLVPNLSDWTNCGWVLSQIGLKYGYEQIGRGRLTNDTLIAMSAARQGITVLTINERDFQRIAAIRSFKWRLV